MTEAELPRVVASPATNFVALRQRASAFPERYTWLLGVSVSPPLMVSVPPWLWITLTLAVAVTVVAFLVRAGSPVARFGALAVLLGCVPLVTSHPGDRLLVLASFGMALTLAELLDRWLLAPASAPRTLAAGPGGCRSRARATDRRARARARTR